jgi:predicted Fe-Mo cluster-binding NifX family protein
MNVKVVVTAVAGSIDATLDQRFGRAPWYVLVDSETGDWSAHENRAAEAGHGAGIEAARIVASLGAAAVLTGNVGPKAAQTLHAAGIRVHAAQPGTVMDAVDAFRAGRLQELTSPSAPAHHGVGRAQMGGGPATREP